MHYPTTNNATQTATWLLLAAVPLQLKSTHICSAATLRSLQTRKLSTGEERILAWRNAVQFMMLCRPRYKLPMGLRMAAIKVAEAYLDNLQAAPQRRGMSKHNYRTTFCGHQPVLKPLQLLIINVNFMNAVFVAAESSGGEAQAKRRAQLCFPEMPLPKSLGIDGIGIAAQNLIFHACLAILSE